MSNNQIEGLSMPVFTAFGWAGEENALKFALEKLELFIDSLYYSLPRESQTLFPYHGLDKESQSVYLAANEELASGPYIAFFARPMSFEISLEIKEKSILNKAYKAAESQSELLFTLLKELGKEWSLRIQQMEYDENSATATHYQDVIKNSIGSLDNDTLVESVARARFLNGESQWLAPLYLSRRIESEKIAFMGHKVVGVVAEQVTSLTPIIRFLTGQTKKKPKAKAKTPPKVIQAAPETVEPPKDADTLEQFTYLSELKSLHIRRGFINLTPQHWPFFSINVRTETRPVTVIYGTELNKDCSVWRLVPSEQTRIVLAPKVQEWLEDNFGPEEYIRVAAKKINDHEISITLSPVE